MRQRRSDLSEQMAYFPDTGQAVYEENRARCGRTYKLAFVSAFLVAFAVEKIQQAYWSPDAVCGYVKAQGLLEHATVCKKTLYRYIDLGLLPLKNIDLPMKVSRKPKIARVHQYKKVFGQSIEQRAASVQTREEFGHWEIDTVLGSRTQGEVLLTLTERKTRKEHILKIPRKQAACVQQAMQKLKQLYGSAFSFKRI